MCAVRVAWLVLLVLVLVLAPAAARADGDPASDVLYLQDVYLPYEQPSPAAGEDLQAAVADANKAGYRIKVAVIASPADLGLVGSLMNKPRVYARFLGAEVRSFFTGHLLVLMPSGFGFWYDRFDVTAQLSLLRGVHTASPDAAALTTAAAAAVRLLQAKDTSKPHVQDISAPAVRADPAAAKRGQVARLRFLVSDNSGRSREEVRVYGAGLALLAVLSDPMERAHGRRDEVTWRVPKSLRPRLLRFCVVAVDPSGNQSKASCAALHVT